MKISKERLRRVWGVPLMLRILNPSWSYCEICGLPWKYAKNHTVQLDKYEGCFCVCEHCYQHATDEELRKAYQRTWWRYWTGNTNHPYGDFVRVFENDIEQRKKKKNGSGKIIFPT